MTVLECINQCYKVEFINPVAFRRLEIAGLVYLIRGNPYHNQNIDYLKVI